MKSLVTSSDDNASDQESTMDKYAIYSKDKVYELKNSNYMKKKIISAIKKSLKSNNNKHSLTLNDVSVSEEKEIGNGCRQSLNIRIALDDKLYYSSGDPINIETFKLNDATPETKCCSHCSGGKEIKSEDLVAYFSCMKCGRKEQRKWYHENCQEKCCVATSIYCDNCLRFKLTSIDHNFEVLDNKFAKYMYVVTCPNGSGISLHMDYERIMHFTQDEQQVIAKEFLKEAFKEDKKGYAQFTIAIVHNGASYMPDLLKMLSELHPSLPVNTTKLKCSTETELMDLGTYYTKVKETYSNGTFAFNPLNEIQAASVKNNECGAYLPELLSLLEKSAFLTQVLPWSDMTTKKFKSPHESDDGPIFWCRPGEQIISLDRNSKRNRWNADEIESFLKERQQNLKYYCEKRFIVEELKKYRRSYSSRETKFEDRTRPHADQVWGNNFECTAAVGVIQAIHPDEIPEQNRACKEIVVFHAKHFEMLEALLHIDITAAPKQQCAEWLDDAKLNMIRQMNIRYSKLHLYDNDIYFIPRKIVHQFKTISATLSVAWHTRLIEYYLEPDPPLVPEPTEDSETVPPIKGEQLSDDDDSCSCSSDSLPPPVATPKKSTAGTPKKKRKLSCSRSTASTDNEATPRKKKKPRSRSSTPQKRAPATPKKRAQKTPKKALLLKDDEDDDDEKKTASQSQKRTSSPEVRPESPAVPVSQPKESSSSRSSSPVAVERVKKKKPKESSSSRSSSPAVVDRVKKKKNVESSSPSRSTSPVAADRAKKKSTESNPRSRSSSPVAADRVKKKSTESSSPSRSSSPSAVDRVKKKSTELSSPSRSSSPSAVDQVKKKSTELSSPSRSSSPVAVDQVKKKSAESSSPPRSSSPVDIDRVKDKSKSKSPPPSTKKRDTDEGESSKKKKRKSRSRSRSRKRSDTGVTDKDRKVDTSEGVKSSSKKKKKNRSRSRSPKKSNKSKDEAPSSSSKTDSSGTPSKSSKKSSKKHDDDHSKSSPVEKQRKKHRSDKDHKSRADSHRSDSSPKRRNSDKAPPTVSTESSLPSTDAKEVKDVAENVKSPPTSTENVATKVSSPVRSSSPPANLATACDATETQPETVDETVTAGVSQVEDSASSPTSPIREPEEPETSDVPSRKLQGPETPPSSPPSQAHIKSEPETKCSSENGPTSTHHEPKIKSESLDDDPVPVRTEIKEEPGALTAAETKNTTTSAPPATKSVPERPIRKPATGSSADSTPRTGKDHRKKEKLWDTPLFMPQDCDKYEWTKRSAGGVVSNRATTKNGDKIVKQKTLNSIQHQNSKAEEAKTSNSSSAATTKPARSRSKSPPPWLKKKDTGKPPLSAETKKSSSGEKRSTSGGVVDKEKSTSTSSSSDKHRSDKEKKSSSDKRTKDIAAAGKKDAERSQTTSTSDKKKSSSSSSHTKDTSGSKSTSGGKEHSTHEKRKRSKSPPDRQHRDKHSSSKKHKKHRSKSRERAEPSAEKGKNSGDSKTTSNAPATESKNISDAELAAGYNLMVPRVQIFDVGAKYKNASLQNTSETVDSEESKAPVDVDDSVADVNSKTSDETGEERSEEVGDDADASTYESDVQPSE